VTLGRVRVWALPIAGITWIGPANAGCSGAREKEVGLMIFFLLFGLLILAATGHMILR